MTKGEIIKKLKLEPTGVVYPIIEYNEQGRVIYEKHSDGTEYWYDEQGRVIHEKHPSGTEYWYEYNEQVKEQVRVTHKKYSDGRYIIDDVEYVEAKK